jgi:predicted permease
MELWIKVFEVILPVIIVILTGFCFGKVTNVNLKPVNLLLLYISTPCLIFSSLMDGKITMEAAYQILIAGTLMIFTAMVLFSGILKILKKNISTFLNPLVFPNTANMALPIALYAFGNEAFEYAIIFTTLVFFYHCSVGIFILNGRDKIMEVFKTPLIYAVSLALLLNNNEIKVHVGLNNAINLLGTTSIPLMMFSLGHKLSETTIVNLNENLLLSSFRLLIGSALGYSICAILGVHGMIAKVMILQFSMPSAVFNFILSDRYNKSPEKVASLVFVSTVLSIIFIPIILYLLMKQDAS